MRAGQLIRIRREDLETPKEELVGVVGRIEECWTAFHLEPPADCPGAYQPVEPEFFESSTVYLTPDSVYGGDRSTLGESVERWDWIRLDADFVAHAFMESL